VKQSPEGSADERAVRRHRTVSAHKGVRCRTEIAQARDRPFPIRAPQVVQFP
jgi:hypothetical protein